MNRRPTPRAAARSTEAESRADAHERARQARRRAALDRARFDPAPPTDEDVTVPEEDTDGLRRLPPPTPIGETLLTELQRRGWGERLHAATLAARWDEVVGPALAPRCEPVRVAGGTLVIRAATAVWATELRYLGPQVLVNVATVLGSDKVAQVRMVVGPLERDVSR